MRPQQLPHARRPRALPCLLAWLRRAGLPQALESQAGFPADINNAGAAVVISPAQWDAFVAQFRLVLRLLRQISHVSGARSAAWACGRPRAGSFCIAHAGRARATHSAPCASRSRARHASDSPQVWELTDPYVIAGFDMDRLGTVQALVPEPPGTFVLRFSMSQPGCLVLSARVAPGHPNADGDGLLHALIDASDLAERRVETWVRDFPGASHVLDVYRNKRVDKRSLFSSAYTRLRAMDPLDAYDDVLV